LTNLTMGLDFTLLWASKSERLCCARNPALAMAPT